MPGPTAHVLQLQNQQQLNWVRQTIWIDLATYSNQNQHTFLIWILHSYKLC